jgi:hypothetical protein
MGGSLMTPDASHRKVAWLNGSYILELETRPYIHTLPTHRGTFLLAQARYRAPTNEKGEFQAVDLTRDLIGF